MERGYGESLTMNQGSSDAALLTTCEVHQDQLGQGDISCRSPAGSSWRMRWGGEADSPSAGPTEMGGAQAAQLQDVSPQPSFLGTLGLQQQQKGSSSLRAFLSVAALATRSWNHPCSCIPPPYPSPPVGSPSLSRSCPHLTIPAAGTPAQTASCCYVQRSSLLLSGNSVRLYDSHTTSLLRILEERLPLRLREQETPCLVGPTLGRPATPGLASRSSPACSPALQPRRSPRCP